MDRIDAGFNLARDVASQLITLSTGLLGLTVTFAKDLLGGTKRSLGLLAWSWLLHVLSIAAGVWSLLALTGTLMPGDVRNHPPVFDDTFTFAWNVRLPAAAQVLLFLGGTALIVAYGYSVVRHRKS